MRKTVLITGGAGFIGSHLADELLRAGYRVRALDCLSEQVHGQHRRPDYLDPDVELQVGDVRDPQAVREALAGVDAVFHFAARLLNDNPPMVFEDGRQRRDFVAVEDIAAACRLALETPEAAWQVFNVGGGRPYSIIEIAEQLDVLLNGRKSNKAETAGSLIP